MFSCSLFSYGMEFYVSNFTEVKFSGSRLDRQFRIYATRVAGKKLRGVIYFLIKINTTFFNLLGTHYYSIFNSLLNIKIKMSTCIKIGHLQNFLLNFNFYTKSHDVPVFVFFYLFILSTNLKLYYICILRGLFNKFSAS